MSMIKSHPLNQFYRAKTGRRKFLIVASYLATTSLTLLVLGIIGVVILFAVLAPFLPDPNKLKERNTELSTRIMDRNGKILYELHGEKNRTLLKFNEISPNISNATLAIEDSTFYEHSGFYAFGILRAFINRLRGRGLQGGSTITQQVVKNTLLTQERTISRKIKEFILSLEIENHYTKEEILQLYLNETPYGGQNYGVYSASRSYFGKNPSELTLAESAYLAGLPQSPSYYSPFSSDPEAGVRRQKSVLKLMKEKGWVGSDKVRHYLGQEEYNKAFAEELKFNTSPSSISAPHFVFYVKSLLIKKYGEEKVEGGGLQVTTTLDYDWQEKAQEIVKDEVTKSKYLRVGNGSLVAIDPKTGQILVMVGSKDYFAKSEPEGCVSGVTGKDSCTFEPQVNTSISLRQPGSSIKPITYAALLQKGYTASSPFLDVETEFATFDPDKPYKPENYDGKFRGPISLRKSLANSINVTAVKALYLATIPSMVELSRNMGITTLNDLSRYGLSLTLGGGETKVLEMTDVYATFATGGIHRDPVAILEVKDSGGRVMENWRDSGGVRALPEDVSYLISDILSDDNSRSEVFGLGSLLNISGQKVAVKTGTTNDKRDNHAYGYTPSIAVGVWVGNNNNDTMNPLLASGFTGATPIWNRFMKEYLKGKEKEEFKKPESIIEMDVDKLTGMLPYNDKGVRKEIFIKGTEPTTKSPWYVKLEICKEDGRLANDACSNDGKTKTKNFIKILAEVPEWQEAVDKWVKDKYEGEDEYFPPTKKSKYPDGN